MSLLLRKGINQEGVRAGIENRWGLHIVGDFTIGFKGTRISSPGLRSVFG
jgi:hypothetical protein